MSSTDATVGARHTSSHVRTTSPTTAAGTGLVAWSAASAAALALLAAMFAQLARGGGADPWGPMNDVAGAVTYLLLAVLVPALSLPTARTRPSRALVVAMVAGCLAGAAAGLLLVARVLDFPTSTAISMSVVTLHAAWLVWLNRSWLGAPWMARGVARFGIVAGAGYFAGLLVAGASFLLGGASTTNVPLLVGTAIGAAAWAGWPVWGFLAGRHLARTGTSPSPRKGTP